MSLLAPATRVRSRKLGPVRGNGSPSATAPAACETSTLARTCGRWLTAASMRSWLAAAGGRGGGAGARARASAERDDQPVQALEEDPRAVGARREVPGRPLEQVGTGMLVA